MGKKSKLAALALVACMALSLVCFTACEGTPGKSAYEIWLEQGNTGTEQEFLDSLKGTPGTPGTPGTAGKSAYQAWLDAGNTGSEQEFLNSLKGTPGDTPEITVSDDGYWEIDGVKTDQKAQGEPGTTPQITISDDGYWEINGVKTDQKAQGEPGNDGNKIYHGEGDPSALNLMAEEGDMYVDTKEWNVYFFESGSWKKYGSIKGGGAEPVKPTGNQVDISADGEQTISVTLSEGMHIIEADLGATALTTGRLQAKVGDVISELVLSEARSTAADGNKIYYGYVNIKADTSEITIMAKSEAVKATIAFKDWTVPTIKEDEPIEMPIYPNGTSKDNITPIQFDESFLDGKYKVKLNAAEISSGVDVYLDSAMNIFFAPGKYMVDTNILTKKGHKTFYLMEMSDKQGDHVINPAIVTFTAN